MSRPNTDALQAIDFLSHVLGRCLPHRFQPDTDTDTDTAIALVVEGPTGAEDDCSTLTPQEINALVAAYGICLRVDQELTEE